MTAEELQGLLDEGRAAADRHLPELARAYERVIDGVARQVARTFRERLTVIAVAEDWVEPPRPDDLVDGGAAARDARRRTGGVHQNALEAVVSPTAEAVGISWAVAAPLTEALASGLLMRAETVAEGIGPIVGDVIRRARAGGLSVAETAQLIRARIGTLAPYQALLLARSDLVAIGNGGTHAAVSAAAKAGVVVKTKTWLTAGDERVRPTHIAASGQTVPLNQSFIVGVGTLQYPGDPAGPPEEVWNCRCTVVYGEPAPAREEAVTAPPTQELGSEARELLGDFVDTQAKYRDLAGGYVAERLTLHRRITRELLKGARPTDVPRATFLAGGSGAGKSSILRRLEGELPRSAVRVDPDAIKEMLPEYQQLLATGERAAARLVHEETSDIAKALIEEASQRKLNLVIDGTGDSEAGKFLAKISRQADLGYETRVVLVDIPTESAVARAAARAARTGREIPESVIRSIHQKVALRFVEWRDSQFVGSWQLWANEGIAPALIAERRRGVTRIFDRDRYEQAVAKGHET